MKKSATGKDPHHVPQADDMDCSIACVATLMRMTGKRKWVSATLYDAHEIANGWRRATGLGPRAFGKVLAATFKADVLSADETPDSDDHAFVVLTSSYYLDEAGTFQNVGHYVVVRGVKRLSPDIRVGEDATLPANDAEVLVVKVYDPSVAVPYLSPWEALKGQSIKNIWRVPLGPKTAPR